MKMESYEPIDRSTCQNWIFYQAIAVQVFLICMEGLLILRGTVISSPRPHSLRRKQVYAMWSRSRRVLCLLVILVLLETSSMILSAIVIAPDPTINELCLFEKTPPASALFGYFYSTCSKTNYWSRRSAVALLTQSMIMFLTLWRHFTSFARRLPRMNLSTLAVRDGGIAFMGIFGKVLYHIPSPSQIFVSTVIFFGALCYTILGSEYSDVLFLCAVSCKPAWKYFWPSESFSWIVCILPVCVSIALYPLSPLVSLLTD